MMSGTGVNDFELMMFKKPYVSARNVSVSFVVYEGNDPRDDKIEGNSVTIGTETGYKFKLDFPEKSGVVTKDELKQYLETQGIKYNPDSIDHACDIMQVIKNLDIRYTEVYRYLNEPEMYAFLPMGFDTDTLMKLRQDVVLLDKVSLFHYQLNDLFPQEDDGGDIIDTLNAVGVSTTNIGENITSLDNTYSQLSMIYTKLIENLTQKLNFPGFELLIKSVFVENKAEFT